MEEILLIEDDEAARIMVIRSLGPDFNVTTCSSLDRAREALNTKNFDLIMLDLTLPDGDGLQFLAELRNSAVLMHIPVVLFTGRSSTNDHVMGLSLGADDYMIKPVAPLLLKATIKARIKRIQESIRENDVLRLGELRLVISKQKLFVREAEGAAEREIELTSLEFKMLLYFAKHSERIISRDQLISAIWGENVHIIDRTVDGHVSHIRKKINRSTYRIESVRGEGYRFVRATRSARSKSAA